MTLIAVGQGLRKRANAGFSANAQLENRENAAADQIEAAEMQQQSQLYGTSSGIGASYGLQKSLQAGKAATDSISTLNAIPGLSEAGQFSAKGGKLVLDTGSTLVEGQQAINLATNATNQAAQAQALAAGAEAGGTAVVTSGAEAIAATEASLATATTAASSTGTMATLSTIAAPIAIGLGAAFLISKLFD
jgi:hypothetical protein